MKLKKWEPKQKPTTDEAANLIGKVAVCVLRDEQVVASVRAVHYGVADLVTIELTTIRTPHVQIWPPDPKPPRWTMCQCRG